MGSVIPAIPDFGIFFNPSASGAWPGDLTTGKKIAKGSTRARMDRIDATPMATLGKA